MGLAHALVEGRMTPFSNISLTNSATFSLCEKGIRQGNCLIAWYSDHISVTQLPCCLQQAGTQQAGGEKVGKNTTFLVFDVCSTTSPIL